MEETPLNFEANVFLLMPSPSGPVKVHFKIGGQGPEVLDALEQLVGEKLGAGYLPDSRGQGGFAAPRNQDQGGTSSGEKPTKFQVEGVTWYVNESRKEPGKFYVGRKNSQTGKYDYLKGDAVPVFVREAYGADLA